MPTKKRPSEGPTFDIPPKPKAGRFFMHDLFGPGTVLDRPKLLPAYLCLVELDEPPTPKGDTRMALFTEFLHFPKVAK